MGFRAGDKVCNRISGNQWTLMIDEDERGVIVPFDSSQMQMRAEDCTLIAAATDIERLGALRLASRLGHHFAQPTAMRLLEEKNRTP